MSQSKIRYLEEFEVGRVVTYGTYEVSEEEIIEFAEKYDPQPLHTSREAAEGSFLGGLCASGWHTCAMAMRMMVDEMDKDGAGTSLASPGCDKLRWLKPVRPGDVLSVTSEVTEVRLLKSKPGIGLVGSKMTVKNHKGEPVMSFDSVSFFPSRVSAGSGS